MHPEKFMDDIDKWLFTEFNILGGCSSAQGSMEYSVARMVAEKMQKNTIDKALSWLGGFLDCSSLFEYEVPNHIKKQLLSDLENILMNHKNLFYGNLCINIE